VVKCSSCGRANRAEAHFCDACGARIRPPGASGERRQLTALFCDIVDYTRLTRLLDEEELHKVIGTYQTTVVDVVTRWGGFVESAIGDAVTAFFGFPQAHEDDAERAVRAGLEIMSRVGSVTADAIASVEGRALNLVVRIGIHTGVVVVGDLGTGEPGKRQALGPTLNVAARLQAIAQPGTIVISDACERLVPGLFVTQDLGRVPLKGIEEPVRSYVVESASGERLETHPGRAVPLIGRDRELAELRSCWERARSGHGQVVLLSGEAGIGKSKLVRRLRDQIADAGEGLAFEWRCSPFYTGRPFHPVIEGLTHHLGITSGTPRERLFGAVQTFLAGSGLSFDGELTLVGATNLLAELIAPGTSAGGERETPILRRSRTLDLLWGLTSARARDQASVMVMEDLHWADPSTIELLGLLASRCNDVPLLLVFTFRPDFVPPWPQGASVHTLNIEPLPSEQCAELFDALVGPRQLSPRLREEVLSKAEGVPLFVEELIQAVLATGADQVTSIGSMPNNLRSLIVSRIDRLSEGAIETVHLASALSREFRFDLLATVSEKSGTALRKDLSELAQSGLIYRRQSPSTETYVFKHALIAEFAYDSILHSDRRRLHARIAWRLRDAMPAMVTEQPEFLAHHFGEGGDGETAVEYWRQAGDAAIARGAFREALSHFANGEKHLAQIENRQVRLRHEIELTTSRGTALFSMLGYADPRVESTFAHALRLCEEDGSSPALRVVYGLWAANLTRNNRDALTLLLPRFDALATSGDPVALLAAHANAGVYAFLSGDFGKCLEKMTEATRWYATSEHSAFLRRHGYGGGLYPFAYRAWSLLILGRAHEAALAADQLQVLAEESGNPYGLAIAKGFLITLTRDRRAPADVLTLADCQLEYTQRQMLAFWEGPARCSRGWARVCLGQLDGVSDLREGLELCKLVGLRATYPYHFGGLVEALLVAGDVVAALTAATEAIAMCQTGVDRFYESELRRFYGEAQWRLGDLVAAESAFNEAIDIAVRQSAKLFALRAVISLARLLIESGRGGVARQTLESVLPALATDSDLVEVDQARDLLSAFA
jgi:class 3 adenylate cyclase